MRNVSDKLVQCLEELDIRYVFTVPGKETAALLLALKNSMHRKMEVVVCRHEQAAVFMADGFARATGKPQVVLSTLGPGAANCVTGVANALLDQVPLLLITAQAPTTRMHRSSFQLIDTRAMFAPLTVGLNEPIRNAASVPEVVSKAFRMSMTRMGPTHIILPEDIAKMPIEDKEWDSLSPMPPCGEGCVPYPNETTLRSATDFLMHSERPVILAGRNSVRHKTTAHALQRLVDSANIMFMTTTLAKGVVDMDHHNSLFTVGYNCTWQKLKEVLRHSDCVISVGFDQKEFQPEMWNTKMSRRIIHIDYDATESNVHYDPQHEIVGDISVALERMLRQLQDRGKRFGKVESFVQARSEIWGRIVKSKDDDMAGKVKPQRLLQDLHKVLDRDSIIVTDMGNHTLFVSKFWRSHAPNQCIVPSNFATMGFGLPAAIGVKMARPDKKVVAIVGDGGLLMNLQEMETANRLRTNILMIVFDDKAYGMIRWEMETEFGEGKSTCVDFENPDFVRVAEAFGWKGFRCATASEFPIVLARAMDAVNNGPVLIDVAVDYISTMKILNQ